MGTGATLADANFNQVLSRVRCCPEHVFNPPRWMSQGSVSMLQRVAVNQGAGLECAPEASLHAGTQSHSTLQ